MKILLLEDELMLQTSIHEYIEALGYEINCFSDGLEANKELHENEYDLLLLDINVPNISGLEILENLKNSFSFVPTIFISADTSIDTISKAFEYGAIDYLKKPFHLKELGLRLQKEIANIEQSKNVYINLSKNYYFSQDDNMLFFNKEPQKLTNKKLQIVKYLALNIGRVITIDTLREYIWNNEPVSDATIRTEMSRLKKSLSEDFIQNIKGVGYTIDKYNPNL
jgi:DNA-binding response OmpR family regulator